MEPLTEEKDLAAWEAYLKAQQKRAQRAALRQATLAEKSASAQQQRGSIDGKGTIQLVFIPPPRPAFDPPDGEESETESDQTV